MSLYMRASAILRTGGVLALMLGALPAQAQETGFSRLHERWLQGGLIGADNEIAAARRVTITEHAQGYSVHIANQFGFTCQLTANASGNPELLSDCASASSPEWRIFEDVKLRCRPNNAEYLCTGPVRLCTADLPPDNPNWTLRIASVRRP